MLIKYTINDSKLYGPDRPIRVSSYSEIGRSLLNELRKHGHYLSQSTKCPLNVPELGITIKKIDNNP